MCPCRQQGEMQRIRNYEREAYQFWKRLLLYILATAVLVVMFSMKIYYLHQHFNERYTRYFGEAQHNKTQGEDLVRGSCQGKPLDYRMAALDCSWAHQMNAIDPHYTAFALAMDHLFEDHLSVLSLLGGCHDGVCNSFLWLFAEKVLNNFHFTVLMITTAGCVVAVGFFWAFANFYTARQDNARIIRLASPEERTKQEAQVYNAVTDADNVRSAIQVGAMHQLDTDKTVDALEKTCRMYRQYSAQTRAKESAITIDRLID